MNKANFIESVRKSYSFQGESILLGSAVWGENYDTGCQVGLPLKTMNRHGLIAGATGTGKTKTLQVFAESLSDAGVPVMVMDIKGDLSGLGAAGETNPIIEKRAKQIGMEWQGKGYPIEFLSISDEPGIRMKATISEYGPVLLSKILELNDNQTGVLSMIFKFCDDRHLPLLDIKDLKSVINFVQEEGKEDFLKEYGYIQSSTAGSILRSIIALEQQKAGDLFGEPSFEIADLMQKNSAGEGYINILRLTDMQDKPGLFSTFMLCLLAEIFQKMPEKGDAEKPELVIFIDEAHLIFKNASRSLLDQFEMTIKLIRSKGVGIFFVTQSPNDIPASILGQLGTKVQHALRAFTANDRKAIKAASENYPSTEFYQVDELITQLGMGEALVTGLNEKGIPTELVHTMLRPPFSRMDVLTDYEIGSILKKSSLIKEYNVEIDRESAYEILHEKMREKELERQEEEEYSRARAEYRPSRKDTESRTEPSTFEQILKSPVTHTIAREVARGIFGVLLGGSTKSPRRRR
jgi:DNA helicase HerA-like ATPase